MMNDDITRSETVESGVEAEHWRLTRQLPMWMHEPDATWSHCRAEPGLHSTVPTNRGEQLFPAAGARA